MGAWFGCFQISGVVSLSMKLSRSVFFDCEKIIQNKMSPTTTTNSVPAPTPKPTLEIIQAYFLQIIPPGDSKQKKIHASLKIQFQVGSV